MANLEIRRLPNDTRIEVALAARRAQPIQTTDPTGNKCKSTIKPYNDDDKIIPLHYHNVEQTYRRGLIRRLVATTEHQDELQTNTHTERSARLIDTLDSTNSPGCERCTSGGGDATSQAVVTSTLATTHSGVNSTKNGDGSTLCCFAATIVFVCVCVCEQKR
jgi:hypothetical protein